MRWRAAAALALLAAAAGAARADPLDDALARARRENRAVVLEFRADWCKPCRLFERAVLALPAVQDALRGRIFLSIDVDDADGEKLSQRYKVRVIPTFLSFDPSGEELERSLGIAEVATPQAFIAFFDRAEVDRLYRRASPVRLALAAASDASEVRLTPGTPAAGWALARAATTQRLDRLEIRALFQLHAGRTRDSRQLAFTIYAALAAGATDEAAAVADQLLAGSRPDPAALAAAGHAYAESGRLSTARDTLFRCFDTANAQRERQACFTLGLRLMVDRRAPAIALVRHAARLRLLGALGARLADPAAAERAAEQAAWGETPAVIRETREARRPPGTLWLHRGLIALLLGVRSDAGLSGDGRFQVDSRALVAFTRGFEVKPLLLASGAFGIDFADEVAYEGAAEIGFAAAGGLIGIYSGILASDHGANSDSALGIPIELAVFFPGKRFGIEAFARTTILFAGDEARRTGSNDAPLGADELSLGLAARIPNLDLPLQVGIRHDQVLDTTLTGIWLGVQLMP